MNPQNGHFYAHFTYAHFDVLLAFDSVAAYAFTEWRAAKLKIK